MRESGLGTKFYVPLVFELLVFNKVTRKYTSIKGVYSSPFTYANRAWGYVDMLGMRWLDFLAPTCPWRTEQDELSVMVLPSPPSPYALVLFSLGSGYLPALGVSFPQSLCPCPMRLTKLVRL